ncbi:MAG: LysR family transcriptional regulator [Verrucomicrobiota bacterium]
MNVHHLELFYFVGKYRGITPAVRRIPYGIQQPAVSSQLLKLEEELGCRLFQRRPFSLTRSGQTLFDFIQPFFDRLPEVVAEVKGEQTQRLRLAASSTVLRNYLPFLLKRSRRYDRDMKLSLRPLPPNEAESLLISEDLDVAIGITEGRPDPGCKATELLEVPMVLLGPAEGSIKTFRSVRRLLETSKDKPALIALPAHEPMVKLFRKELQQQSVDWDPAIEVTQLDLVDTFVAEGFGFGISADVPGLRRRKSVRVIPLPGFPKMKVEILHRSHPGPLVERFVADAVALAGELEKL